MRTPMPTPTPSAPVEPSVEQILTSGPVTWLVAIATALAVLVFVLRMIARTWRLLAAAAVVVFLTIWTQAQCHTPTPESAAQQATTAAHVEAGP